MTTSTTYAHTQQNVFLGGFPIVFRLKTIVCQDRLGTENTELTTHKVVLSRSVHDPHRQSRVRENFFRFLAEHFLDESLL